MTVAEAEHRLAGLMFDEIPYSDNDISVKIVVPVVNVPTENLPLQQASKIALIKMVRSLAEDLRHGRLKMTSHRDCTTDGRTTLGVERYFGLADAKDYVETYLKNNDFRKKD